MQSFGASVAFCQRGSDFTSVSNFFSRRERSAGAPESISLISENFGASGESSAFLFEGIALILSFAMMFWASGESPKSTNLRGAIVSIGALQLLRQHVAHARSGGAIAAPPIRNGCFQGWQAAQNRK